MPRRDPPDPILQPQRLGAAQRREPERPDRVELGPAQSRDLVGFAQRLQQRQGRAGADIGAEPDPHRPARIEGVEQPEQAAAEEAVRGRAMGDRRAAGVAGAEILLRQVDRVAEHRARADEAGLHVDVEIARPVGEQFTHPGDLVGVLAQMGLEEEVVVLPHQGARGIELSLRAGGGEARGDAVMLAPAPVPAFDQGPALVVAALRRIEETGRGVAVHQDLAGDHPGVEAGGFGEERLDRAGMDRAVDHRRGGARAQDLAEEQPRHPLGMGLIGELQLRGEGILLEPGQQLLAVGGDHLQLRIVDVGVDQAGQDQGALVGRDRDARRNPVRQLRKVAEGGDVPVLDQDQGVGHVLEAALGQEGVAGQARRLSADRPHPDWSRRHASAVSVAAMTRRKIRSGANGVAVSRTPVASRIALARAAATGL